MGRGAPRAAPGTSERPHPCVSPCACVGGRRHPQAGGQLPLWVVGMEDPERDARADFDIVEMQLL